MRKNVKKQLALRVLSTAALVAMVSSIATAAFADTYDLNKGSVTVETKEDGFTYVTQENTEINDHQDNTGVTITSNGEKTSNTITVETAKDQTTDVTLDNVHIEVDTSKAKSGAIEIKGNGDTNLELNGDNTVLVENDGSNHQHAAIEKADTYGKEGTLTIKDDVNNDGTAKTGTEADTTGKLLAGGCDEAAAIGGGGGEFADTSNITITGGEITAIGGGDGGSGIGGGGRPGGAGKNICIEGNAHVTAAGSEGAAIGGGASGGNSITIKDHAVVNAFGTYGSAIGDGGMYTSNKNLPTTITISGNATVYAETSEGGCAIGSGQKGNAGDLTINIEENANVTAISAYDRPAIGNYFCYDGSTTTINITGGTVNAINSFGYDSDPSYDGTDNHSPAIGGKIYKSDSDGDHTATCNVNINSSTGDTIVNAYIYGKGSGTAIGSMICTDTYNDITHRYDSVYQYVPADGTSYHADGSSNFGESNSAIVNCYNNGTVAKETLRLPGTKDPYVPEDHEYRHTITGGTLTKVVHNRKYMDETIDTSDLKDEDLHDWKLVGKVVEPTTEKDGYADYICSIDKCGQTKHVVLPKIVPDTPSTPDTPDTPNTPSTPDKPSTPDVPSTPEVTPADPAVTPDAVQADAAPADAAVTPAAAQNVVQNAKPEAAAVSAAALPQTGANWLAVAGSALSGLFLLAAGFVLDRKGRRMN